MNKRLVCTLMLVITLLPLSGCSLFGKQESLEDMMAKTSPSYQPPEPEPEQQSKKWSLNPFSKKQDENEELKKVEMVLVPIVRQGDLHKSKYEYDQARQCYEKALEIYANNPQLEQAYSVYWSLAVVSDMQKRYPEAQALYTTAISLEPNNSNLFGDLGYSFFLSGKLSKAESAFKKAIDLKPSDQRNHNNLGLVYGYQNKMDLAYEEFCKAGNQSQAHVNIAEILLNMNRMDEAEKSCNMALQIDPMNKKASDALELIVNLREDPDYLERREIFKRSGSRQMYVEGMELQTAETLAGNTPGTGGMQPTLSGQPRIAGGTNSIMTPGSNVTRVDVGSPANQQSGRGMNLQ